MRNFTQLILIFIIDLQQAFISGYSVRFNFQVFRFIFKHQHERVIFFSCLLYIRQTAEQLKKNVSYTYVNCFYLHKLQAKLCPKLCIYVVISLFRSLALHQCSLVRYCHPRRSIATRLIGRTPGHMPICQKNPRKERSII